MLKGKKLEERMGQVCPRVKFGKRSKADKDEKAQVKSNDKDWIRELREQEAEKLTRIKTLIRDKPNVFILNNLLMSCQLFANYEAEIEEAREKAERRSEDMRKKLDSEKSILMPDALREHFDDRMRFTSHSKNDKDDQTIEPLRPVQIYLVYDNVIITETSDPKQYEIPNKLKHAQYTFALQANSRNGYIRLEQPSKLSSLMESIDEIYNESKTSTSMIDLTSSVDYFDNRNASEKNSSSTQDLRSSGSLASQDDTASDVYAATARITRLTNPSSTSSTSSGYTSESCASSNNSSNDSTISINADTREIPSSCFKSVTYMYNGKIYNPRKEQRPLTSQQKRIRDAKLSRNYDVVYVNSYRFAKHFYSVFRDQLATRMGFDETSVKSAKRCDATVRLETIDYSQTKNCICIEQYEIIPCFSSPCPEWSQRWLKRFRTSWPNEMDLAKLSKYQCYLTPESQRLVEPNVEQSKPLWKLDWCMTFATAEYYLETRLSAPQMTVYVIAQMLHKTFIRTVGSSLGLDTSHIRNLLFWMVEKTPERGEFDMGGLMVDMLETLHSRIQKRIMPDYFLEARNLFENVHTDDLLHSQKQLKRIIENPVMFVFHAMEKMQYEEQDYPRFDYKELLRLLTFEELLLVNPGLEVKKQEEMVSQNYSKGERRFWNDAKQTGNYYSRKRSVSTLINPKQVIDSIIDIQEKCEPLNRIRLSELLIFFSKHFIEMSKSCNTLGAAQQKSMYLKQTRLLALLLTESEDLDHKHTAEMILKRVNEIEENPINAALITRQQQRAPETPKRNADEPLARRRLNDTFGFNLPPVSEESSDKVVRVDVHDMPIKSALSKPNFLKKTAMTSAMKSKVEATSL